MRKRLLICVCLILIPQVCFALNGNDRAQAERSFSGFLFDDQKGDIWTAQLWIRLGMFGVASAGQPPVYQLSPELAERFRPLAVHLDPKPEDGAQKAVHCWGFPREANQGKPTVLVDLETKVRLVKDPSVERESAPAQFSDLWGRARVFEIHSAKLVSAEFVSPEWRQTWGGLGAVLNGILSVSFQAPGEDKREELKHLIEQGCRALSEMMQPPIEEEWVDTVHRIDTRAHLVTGRQFLIVREWGSALKMCVERTGVLPPSCLPWTAQAILADSTSPVEFLAGMQAAYGEKALEQPIIWSWPPVDARSVAEATPEAFDGFRQKVISMYGDLVTPPVGEAEHKTPPRVRFDDSGLVVRLLTPEELAENMVLSGIFIEEVLPQGKKWSLEEGDVIVKRVEPIYGFPMDGYRRLWTGPSGEKYEQSVKRAMKGFIDHEKGRIRSDNLLIRGSELVRLGDEEE